MSERSADVHVKGWLISPWSLCVSLTGCRSLRALMLETVSAGSTHYWAGEPCLTGWSAFCDGAWTADAAPSLYSWGQIFHLNRTITSNNTMEETKRFQWVVCLSPSFTLQAGCWRRRSWPGAGASEETERGKETTSLWSQNSPWWLLGNITSTTVCVPTQYCTYLQPWI